MTMDLGVVLVLSVLVGLHVFIIVSLSDINDRLEQIEKKRWPAADAPQPLAEVTNPKWRTK